MTKVLISCGEASGDMYAAALTSELVRLDPGAQVFGLGGDRMTAAGARLIGHYHGLSVTGLVEALAVLPRALAMYRRLVDAMRRDRPDVLVAVDFPDFNFRLASAGRRLGLPVVYYVGPQVWAWRRGRLRTLKRFVDRMLVIFPFEEAVYRDAGIPVEFVGHPLVDLAEAKTPRATLLAECGLKLAAPTVALLPGSRPNEVEQLLPILVEAARMIVAGVPEAQFIIARAPNLDESLFSPLAHWRGPRRPAVIEARTDDVLSAVDVVATASGTATIQAAIHGRPMVIIYRVSPLTYVRAGLPPVLTIHGDSDPIVPYDHGVRLHEALGEAGVPNQLVTVEGGGHGGFSADDNIRIYAAIRAFLGQHRLVAVSSNE